jgi:hypothetical protein
MDEEKQRAGHEAADEVRSEIRQAFDEAGVTPKYLTTKIKAELNAKETKVFKAKALEQTSDGRVVEVEKLVYSKPLVSWDVRQKARQDAHKLRGDYPPEKQEHTIKSPVTFTVKFDKSNGNGNGGE